jgi:hypothetical protein
MRPLIIDDKIKEEIQRLKDHAEKNIFTIDDLKKIVSREVPHISSRPGFTIEIPIGYHVVFSMSEQKLGIARELSVSINDSDKKISPEAMQLLLDEFGFDHPITECVVKESSKAIYIAELIDKDAHDQMVKRNNLVIITADKLRPNNGSLN